MSSPVSGSSTAQKAVVHAGARQPGGEPVEARQRRAGAGMFQQQCPTRAAQLSHHGGRGQAVPHAVADDQRDAPVVEVDHVVPVAADLQRARGGLISHRETAGQAGGSQDRMLQRQSGFALPSSCCTRCRP